LLRRRRHGCVVVVTAKKQTIVGTNVAECSVFGTLSLQSCFLSELVLLLRCGSEINAKEYFLHIFLKALTTILQQL
jgi:hypothetical protein